MAEKEFESGHWKFLKGLNIQGISDLYGGWQNAYMLPESNFEQLERKLHLLSCGCETQYWEPEIFCNSCKEKIKVLKAGGEDHQNYFYAFSQDIYFLLPFATIKSERTEELTKQYLKKSAENLEKKCLEGLKKKEKVRWGNEFVGSFGEKKEGQIEKEIDKIYWFLGDIEGLSKKQYLFYDHHNSLIFEKRKIADLDFRDVPYSYRFCSKHLSTENVQNIKDNLAQKIIHRFASYGTKLEKEDIKIDFEKIKIFSIRKKG